jgi:hypothetical protein
MMQPFTAELGSGQITFAPVPEPGTLLLCAAGLGSLALRRLFIATKTNSGP